LQCTHHKYDRFGVRSGRISITITESLTFAVAFTITESLTFTVAITESFTVVATGGADCAANRSTQSVDYRWQKLYLRAAKVS
jgi:hypothetical protein